MQEWAKLIRTTLIGAIATGILLIPIHANALGFGNIEVKSALNEPLMAEIELLSATDEDVKELQVKLASREAFLRAGVDRSAELAQIKFNIVKKNNRYVIQLRTPQAVREPFLNFLLEMNWKNGRMLREYTVLLDPPDRRPTQMAKAPEPTPPVTVAPVEAPVPTPTVEPATPAPASTTPAPSPFMAETAPATTVASAEPATPAAPATPAEPVPAPIVDTPVDEKPKAADKKTSKKKTKDKKAKGKTDTKPVEPAATPAPSDTPVPSAEPLIAADTTAATAPKAGEEDLFPKIPLTENNQIDSKALDADIKQSKKQRQEDKMPKPEVAVAEPAPAPAPIPDAAPVSSDPIKTEIVGTAEPAKPAEPLTETTSAPVTATTPTGTLDYGITRKGDNLWTIAEKIKPNEEVTIYQVMMALQQSNPDAFVKGNIHRLKSGQVMRIEDPRLLSAMSKKDAASQYEVQTRQWQDFLASSGVAVPRQAIVAGDTGTDSTGKDKTPSGELTLTPPSTDKAGVGEGGSDKLASKQNSDQLRSQVKQAVDEAASERRKNAQLSSKVEELEKELKRLENLVTIKDSDLASLQRKLEELQKKRSELNSKPTEVAAVTPPVSTPPAPVESPKPAVVEPVVPVTPTESKPDVTPPVADATLATTSGTETPPASQPDAVTSPAATAPTPVSSTPEPVQMDGGVLAKIKGMMGGMGLYIVIGGVVLVLLLILVFVWIRRRNSIHFQESILKTGGSAQAGESGFAMSAPASAMTAEATPSQQSSLMSGGESSFLSDFAISGVSAIQAEDSEVDPLTEADVFMAYGRYEAAEERLQEAIKQDPKRGELRVKLLELFTTTKNKKEFEAAAEDYYGSLGGATGGNALWQKVVAMGTEIAPNNPLFKDAVGGGRAHTSTSNLNDSKVMDIGLDTGAFSKSDFATPTPPPSQKAKVNEVEDSIGLDFNLEFDKTPAAKSTGGASKSTDEEDTGIDFNLETSSGGGKSSDTGGGLDFNLDMGSDDEPTATDIKFDMADSGGGLDFDLESPGSKGNGSGSDMNLDAADAINLDMPSGGDEVGTKLDLARAYIDMGDPDGARSILDEVISEGNDGQKQEARQLMQQIG